MEMFQGLCQKLRRSLRRCSKFPHPHADPLLIRLGHPQYQSVPPGIAVTGALSAGRPACKTAPAALNQIRHLLKFIQHHILYRSGLL